MAVLTLYDYQLDAISRLHNGSILCGTVGSGKSRTALGYYYISCGGSVNTEEYVPMKYPLDLYIITTARKRDTCEWEEELTVFLLSKHPEANAYPGQKIVIDSWNNIKKYENVENAFFIFDEQRVVGKGAWVKSFLRITKTNQWLLLSATPGDTWSDYIPVFIANGFYKNRSEFSRRHIVYSRYTKYPKVDHYVDQGRLVKLRRDILVTMDFQRETVSHKKNIFAVYDMTTYKTIIGKNRWNPYSNEPIANASELCYVWRKCVNSDPSRKAILLDLMQKHPKVIVFYNFDYELDILRGIEYGTDVEVAEWNGHKHEPIPKSKSWVYLVQYTAGCEGWNCIETDTIIFYSQNYSYKVMEQASGRINRLNTPFKDLYYYSIKSYSPIDLAIARALEAKKNFNENSYIYSEKL